MLRLTALVLCLTPSVVLAVGLDDDDPPKPTPTTTECTDGKVWDAETDTCVDVESGLIDDDIRYAAVREFAYAGRLAEAQRALDAMREGASDRVLTYRGFLARRTGDLSGARALYEAALAKNPDNLLARSYMGMGLLEAGDRAGAEAQLAEIRARGGAGGWPEAALNRAISSGHASGY